MPERSGLIKPFNAFHQSLGELLFELSFSTNLSRSVLFGFPDFICNQFCVVFIVFMINYSTCPTVVVFSFFVLFLCYYEGVQYVMKTIHNSIHKRNRILCYMPNERSKCDRFIGA